MQDFRVTFDNSAGSPAEATVHASSAVQAAFIFGRNLGRDSRAVLRGVFPLDVDSSRTCGECSSPPGEMCAPWCTGSMPGV